MSQIDFENLTSSHPELSEAWDLIAQWVSRHPSVRFAALPRLARALDISASELAMALSILESMGHIRYRVQDIDGTFLPKSYSDIREIPARVPGRYNETEIDIADTEVVSGISLEL